MAKRSERLARAPANPKSPKRLDTVFNNLLKLENALTKTVESFTESDRISSEDNEMNSLEQTAVEVNKNLSDTEPIYKLLINCNDTIHIIIDELSSTDMKSSLLKEFEGKVTTVSDLAKLTELEINKFSIKTPKVQVARKVLKEYADKTKSNELPRTEDNNDNQSMKLDDELNNKIDMEVQTELNLSLASTQTEVAALSTQTQTLQSGDMTTMCLIAYLFKVCLISILIII